MMTHFTGSAKVLGLGLLADKRPLGFKERDTLIIVQDQLSAGLHENCFLAWCFVIAATISMQASGCIWFEGDREQEKAQPCTLLHSVSSLWWCLQAPSPRVESGKM